MTITSHKPITRIMSICWGCSGELNIEFKFNKTGECVNTVGELELIATHIMDEVDGPHFMDLSIVSLKEEVETLLAEENENC